ncbi:MAG TPA: flagellar motor switch protein FliN [Candidatus Nanopelagicaceae bacterium]|nr:flagellar motor switch protein FliN [Candidatus Nanopelagicaceae bacterium]
MSVAPEQTKPQIWTPEMVSAVAAVVAERLPIAETLVPDPPIFGEEIPWPAQAAGAVMARLSGSVNAELYVVVDAELVDFLKNSPVGELDLLAALAPTIAAAALIAGTTAGPLQEVPPVPPTAKVGTTQLASVALVVNDQHRGTVIVRGVEPVATRVVAAPTSRTGLDMLRDIEMEVTVEIGRTRITVRELLGLTPGQVVELDRAAGSPADLLVNGTLLARGEIVVVGEEFGIRITEIVSTDPDETAQIRS